MSKRYGVYTKRSTPVVAFKYVYPASNDLRDWLGADYISESKARHPSAKGEMLIVDPDGNADKKQLAVEGDYIIQDEVWGFHVLKPHVFEQIYSPISN